MKKLIRILSKNTEGMLLIPIDDAIILNENDFIKIYHKSLKILVQCDDSNYSSKLIMDGIINLLCTTNKNNILTIYSSFRLTN